VPATGVLVASFIDFDASKTAGSFTATINWGDGKTSTGTITLSGTTYTVTGSHRYSRSGSHTVTTTVTEIGQAAELLLAKVGDEVPDLPDHYPGNPDHGRPTLNAQANQFARLVRAYLAPDGTGPGNSGAGNGNGDPGRVTLADLRAALTALLDRGDQEGRQPPLATLSAGLHVSDSANPRVLDVLLLLEDLLADRGI
jgi:hypothetical protein